MDRNSVYKTNESMGSGLSGSNIGPSKIEVPIPASKKEVINEVEEFFSKDPELHQQFKRAMHLALVTDSKTNSVDHFSRFLDLYFDSLKLKNPKDVKELNLIKENIVFSKKELDLFLKDGRLENDYFISALAGFFVSLL